MKYCPYCGIPLLGGSVSFCAGCGKKLPLTKADRRNVKKRPAHYYKPEHDAGYDGYYEDVKPKGNGYNPDRIEPELIKRIILISAGACVIVLFSVVLMLLL